jgi:hypothetical protein
VEDLQLLVRGRRARLFAALGDHISQCATDGRQPLRYGCVPAAFTAARGEDEHQDQRMSIRINGANTLLA